MLEKILIGTDFSSASDCLISCIGELKSLGLKRAVLAHIVYVANTPGLEERLMANDAPQLERQKRLMEEQGIEVVTELRLGIPARELKALAEQHAVDAILIGSRGHGLWRSLLGSVSFKLLQIADCPVFLAPVRVVGEGDNCRPSVCSVSFRNILVPVDFSRHSDHVVAYLESILHSSRAAATLLHVIDAKFAEVNLSDEELEGYRKHATGLLDQMKQRLQAAGALVETELVSGAPWEEIVERTRKERFSLVLMGSHGRGFFQEALLGSVANEVSRNAEVPVIFLPAVHGDV